MRRKIDEYQLIREKYGKQIVTVGHLDEKTQYFCELLKRANATQDVEEVREVYRQLGADFRQLQDTFWGNVQCRLWNNVESLRRPMRRFLEGLGKWRWARALTAPYLHSLNALGRAAEVPWALVKDAAWFAMICDEVELARTCAKKALTLFRDEPLGQFNCYVILGMLDRWSKRTDDAMRNFDLAETFLLISSDPDQSLYSRLLCHVGATKLDKGLYPPAMNDFTAALELANEAHRPQLVSVCLNRVGYCHLKMKDYDQARDRLLHGLFSSEGISAFQNAKSNFYLAITYNELYRRDGDVESIVHAYRFAATAVNGFAEVEKEDWREKAEHSLQRIQRSLPEDYSGIAEDIAEILFAGFNEDVTPEVEV